MPRRRSASRTRQQRSLLRSIIVILLILLLAYAVQQGYIDRTTLRELGLDPPGEPDTLAPLVYPDDAGSLQAFFTTSTLVYPDEPERRTATPVEQALIADIDAAQSSVDIAVFEYNLESIGAALARAQERGVTVRLALDEESLEKPEMARWAGAMEQADIPIAWQEGSAFLHSKFIIVDNVLVWMGSWNMTTNGTYRNNNNLLRITIPPIVENYAAEFEQMSAGRFGNAKASLAPHPVIQVGDIRIENYFSPQDRPAPRLVKLLQGAQQTIHVMAFSFTSDEIAQAMLDRSAAGVTVQGVFERRNAGGTGAEFDLLKSSGIDVWEDGNCYTMHHKVIIIDERTVITGSYNFTVRAEETNDENLLIVDDPALAQQFLAEFDRIYAQARTPTRCNG